MVLNPCGRRRRRPVVATGCLGALLLLAAVAPSANAAWTEPVDLSAPTDDAVQPSVAADEAGAAFAWVGGPDGVVQTRTHSWAGALSEIQDVSAPGEPGEVSFGPDVAVTGSGRAAYAWAQFTQAGQARVQGRSRTPGGALGATRSLSPLFPATDTVGVGVDSEGDAVAVWTADRGTYHQIQARTWTPGGPRGPLLELSPPGQDATLPEVAVDADGDAVFVWQRREGTSFRAEARVLTAAGVLEPTVVLNSTRWTSVTPQVAVNPSGVALFVWRSSDPSGAGGSRIETRARLTSGTFTRRQTVADGPGNHGEPRLAIADDGAGLYAWRTFLGSRQLLRARPRSALGGLGAEETFVSAPGEQVVLPARLTLDADGDAVLAWARYDATSTTPPCCTRAQARTRSSLGAYGPVKTLSEPEATAVDVAGDASGDAVVAWHDISGGPRRIQAAAGP